MRLHVLVPALLVSLAEASYAIEKRVPIPKSISSSVFAQDSAANTSPIILASTSDPNFAQKRDDVAFQINEDEEEKRERIYAYLDSDELAISPEDRLYRIACAYDYTGNDKGGWANKWATKFKWSPASKISLSRSFVNFAYQARFGPMQATPITQWIQEFDVAYRKLNKLAAEYHEDLAYVANRGPAIAEVLSSYLWSSLLSVQMKSDIKWRTYSGYT